MSTSKTASLSSSLIARKGEAVSTVAPSPKGEAALPHGTIGTLAVTVRLDPVRYEALKAAAARARAGKSGPKTNQEILVTALDSYLRNSGKT